MLRLMILTGSEMMSLKAAAAARPDGQDAFALVQVHIDIVTIQQQAVVTSQAEVALSADPAPKKPGSDVDMEAPPDLGAVVPFANLEGVPIHWHAFIWLSVLACLSLVSITGYCCLAYRPEQSAFPLGSALTSPEKSSAQATPPRSPVGSREASGSCAASTSSRGSTSTPPFDEPGRADDLVNEAGLHVAGQLSVPRRKTVQGCSFDDDVTVESRRGVSDDVVAARRKSRTSEDAVDALGQKGVLERDALSKGSREHSIVRRTSRRKSWHVGQKSTWNDTFTIEDSHETMGSVTFALNIVADLCPSGFISIAYSMEDIGYVPAFGVLIASWLLSCYTMWMVGRTCEITRKSDFATQWAVCIGPFGQWLPTFVIFVVALGALLCYACYFGDLLQELTPAFGFAVPRYACIIGASLFPTLPLCYLKNLSALAYSSGFAVIALVYTMFIMTFRAYDGTYVEGGVYFKELPMGLRPKMPEDAHMWKFGGSSLVYINVLAMAFHCHCNSCKYYRELHKSTPGHFGRCTLIAMGICAAIYGVTAFMGFKTFGFNSEGTILKNYSINDWPINLAKLGVVCSLIASYGIMFAALRESSLSLLKEVSGQWFGDFDYFDLIWRQDVLTTILVCTITLIAVMCSDSGLVDGFVGALCGNAVIYIIPGLLYAASIHVFFTRRRGNLRSIATSLGLAVFGVVLIIGGVFCVVFYELPKVTGNTQFKDVAIYSDSRMSGPDAFLGGVPHHQSVHPASRYILMALVLAPLTSAWAAFIMATKYVS